MRLRGGNRGDLARLTLSPLFLAAGIAHLAWPAIFLSLMPDWVPNPTQVIVATGVAEIAGACGLFVARVRLLTGVMLALYAICVYPVNVLHAVRDLSTHTGLTGAYHYPRLFLQPFICWWALAAGGLFEQRD